MNFVRTDGTGGGGALAAPDHRSPPPSASTFGDTDYNIFFRSTFSPLKFFSTGKILVENKFGRRFVWPKLILAEKKQTCCQKHFQPTTFFGRKHAANKIWPIYSLAQAFFGSGFFRSKKFSAQHLFDQQFLWSKTFLA